MIIFLNGVSSAGKTTIAKALQYLYPNPLLLLGIDNLFAMLPAQYIEFGAKANEGFQFVREKHSNRNMVSVKKQDVMETN